MRYFFPHKKHVSLQIILREVDEIAKQNRKNKKHVQKKIHKLLFPLAIHGY